jgi:hypothetical protein
MKTIGEIQEQFSSEGPAIINEYYSDVGEIRDLRSPADGSYLDRLTDEQRMALLQDQKMEEAVKAHEHAVSSYREQVEYYHRQLEKRTNHIREQLFKVGDAGALSRAATATDAELGAMLEIAAQAQNAELGRAVFVAAEQRGLGDLMASYFDKLNPEGRGLYEEWTQIPPQEILDRQLDVEAVLPAPDPNSLIQQRATV